MRASRIATQISCATRSWASAVDAPRCGVVMIRGSPRSGLSGVTGSLVLASASIASVEVTADMTRLESDDNRRDGRLREQAIETDEFPTATFRLTAPIELGSAPAEGVKLTATATGELTLHGETRAVTVPLEAILHGDVVTVTGSIEILFADYAIERPTSFLVLSIEDHGIMEFQLHFRRG